jgi:hypothetical protein
LGLAEIQLPPASLGFGERVQVLRRRTIFGGIGFRTERADFFRGLVCSECLTKEFVALLRSVHFEGILGVNLFEQRGIWPARELLHEERRIPSQSRRIRSVRGIRHFVRIDGWLQPLFSKIGNAAIPEIPTQPNLQMWVIIAALRTERGVEILWGLRSLNRPGTIPGCGPENPLISELGPV